MRTHSLRSNRMALAGVLLALGAATGCGAGADDLCVANADCRAGEFCDASSAKCRCGTADAAGTVGGSPDEAACAAADAQNLCHPTTDRCVPRCDTSADCASTEECDLATNVCVAGAQDDCTVAGQECASTDACDPTTRLCVERCTDSSCGTDSSCDPSSGLCVDDCTETSCGTDEVCDPVSKRCVADCGEETCTIDEVCGAGGTCIPRCDALLLPTECATTEYCDDGAGTGRCRPKCDQPGGACDATTQACAGTGRCVARCPAFEPCNGSFCNQTSGLCETAVDITDCNPQDEGAPVTREYANTSTNSCEPVSDLVADCPNALKRDGGNAEVPAGPTAYRASQIDRAPSSGNCGGGAEVEVLLEYYDPTGGMFGTTPATMNIAGNALLQAVDGSDANATSSDFIVTCSGTEPGCQGLSSDTNRGAFIFKLCRPGNAPATEKLAVYVKDRAGNWGNTICFDSANR